MQWDYSVRSFPIRTVTRVLSIEMLLEHLIGEISGGRGEIKQTAQQRLAFCGR